jgi:hypothetical protein
MKFVFIFFVVNLAACSSGTSKPTGFAANGQSGDVSTPNGPTSPVAPSVCSRLRNASEDIKNIAVSFNRARIECSSTLADAEKAVEVF